MNNKATETTLLSLHDHIITAVSHQQVSCLCLLDLSDAFDTIDHSILLHRLSSWFRITDYALTWLKTYLTSLFLCSCLCITSLSFHSRPIMYSAVGSLVLSWSWTRQPGFISFWCLWIQLCNNLGRRLCAYNLP